MDVSLIVPVFNEEDNVQLLYEEATAAMRDVPRQYELLFIDDGSRDATWSRLESLAARDGRVRLVRFRRNFGQTAALQAGIDHASGDVMVTLDGDLQNDPADIPMLLATLDEGYDLVHGWRKQRQDAWLHRKLPSRLANWLIARVTRFPIHDLGCTLKAMRRELAVELELYGEMHRFIPILAHQRGARCCEVVTHHRPRRFGKTKYGLSRTIRVVLDLLTVKYLLDYFASPMKLFGMAGIWCAVVAMISGSAVGVMKFWRGIDMTGNPLLLLTVLSVMVAVQFISLGLIGEVMARIYFGTQSKRSYAVRQLVNLNDDSSIHRHAA